MNKFPVLIEITWIESVESLLIESISKLKTGERLYSSEFWSQEGTMLHFNPIITSCEPAGRQYEIQLDYRKEDHPELSHHDDVWGTSTLVLNFDQNASGTQPTASWKHHPKSSGRNGKGRKVKVIAQADRHQRLYVECLRRFRRQQAFKNQLLKLTSQCEISGESEVAALDAAHIHEVKDDGVDHFSNGILLRADLHRLFDRGLLTIEPESGKVELTDKVAQDSLYRQELKGKKLKKATLARVRASLRARQSLP